mgnify:CR=1 FL=1
MTLNPITTLLRWLRRTPDNSTDLALSSADAAAVSETLPYGIEPPPPSRLRDLDWDADVKVNTEVGCPRPGGPLLPLPLWEIAVKVFGADMREGDLWCKAQSARLLALLATAAESLGRLRKEQTE